jgi:16S rRNA processing protein RimM
MNDYFSIGKIVAASGVKGAMILKHSLGKRTNLKGLNAIFLEEKKNSFIPYFIIQSKSQNKEETVLMLEGISNRESVKLFLQKKVYVTEEWFRKLSHPDAALSLLGFTIIDIRKGVKHELGAVEEVIEMPLQILVKVIYKEKELLLPLNEETLLSIDHRTKIAELQLPEGLLDMYLS